LTLFVLVVMSNNGVYRALHMAYASGLYGDRVHAMSVSLRHSMPVPDRDVFVVGDRSTHERARRQISHPDRLGRCAVPDNRLAGIAVCLNRMAAIRVDQPIIVFLEARQWADPQASEPQAIAYRLDPRSPTQSQWLDLDQVRQTFLLHQIAIKGWILNILNVTSAQPIDWSEEFGSDGFGPVTSLIEASPERFIIVLDREASAHIEPVQAALPSGVVLIADENWAQAMEMAQQMGGAE